MLHSSYVHCFHLYLINIFTKYAKPEGCTDMFKLILCFFLTSICLAHGQLWGHSQGDSLTHHTSINAFLLGSTWRLLGALCQGLVPKSGLLLLKILIYNEDIDKEDINIFGTHYFILLDDTLGAWQAHRS